MMMITEAKENDIKTISSRAGWCREGYKYSLQLKTLKQDYNNNNRCQPNYKKMNSNMWSKKLVMNSFFKRWWYVHGHMYRHPAEV